MNPYSRDAAFFSSKAINEILTKPSGTDALPGLLFSALAIERVMKGVLWDVNPTFTLIDTSFKNSAPVLYAGKISQVGSKSRDEIAEKPNRDVISFRSAVLRSGLFSKTVDDHRGALLKLNRFRDVIAHCDLREIDATEAEVFFLGSIHPIFKAFAKEGALKLPNLPAATEAELTKIIINNTVDVESRTEQRLNLHKGIIARKSGVEIQRIENTPHPKPDGGQWDELIDCPACGYKAYVRFEVDFDVEDGQAVPVGVFASYLSCPYCELRIDDFEELEHLGISIDRFTSHDGSNE